MSSPGGTTHATAPCCDDPDRRTGLGPGNNVALGQAPRPVAQYLTGTEGLPPSGPYDVAHHINVYEPGATIPWHTHPCLILVTVIERELTHWG